jgi:hypothetical protein
MLTPETSGLLKTTSASINMGTRDENNIPSLAPVFAFKYNESNNELIIYSMYGIIETHIANLKNNGKITVVIANPADHITNQFKGDYISHDICNTEEIEFVKSFFKGFQDIIGLNYGEEIHKEILKIQIDNCMKIHLKVKEIYDQTPGPGAGKLITEFV